MPTKSMPAQAQDQDIIAIRRQRVQSLRNRMLTHEEIYTALAKPLEEGGLRNPSTLEPYDRTTITRDLQWLRADNLKTARKDAAIHQARQLSEIEEVKRAAWGTRDPELALKALDREMKLLGTLRQPDGQNINISVTLVIETVQALEAAGLDPAATFQALINKAKARLNAGE